MLRKDYQHPKISVPHTRLDFLILSETLVHVNATFIVEPKEDWDGSLTLNVGDIPDIKEIKVDNIFIDIDSIDQVKTSYGKDLVIKDLVSNSSNIVVNVKTELNPKTNTSLAGLYLSNGVIVTQCESHGFRNMFPSFDSPDILSKYKVRIHAVDDVFPVTLSNGNLIEDVDFTDVESVFPNKVPEDVKLSCRAYEDPFAKPSYLFALVAGDLGHIHDVFTTMNGKEVDLYIYADAKLLDQCHFAMGALKRSMKHDEDLYGLEYDLDNYKVVGIDDFNAGAMENKGLNIFNSKYILADPKYATDGGFSGVDAVIAHEYFHNFTGNRVTLRDWFELTLKEGLTVYRDQEYSEKADSFVAARLEQISGMKNHQFKEDAGPTSHPIRPDEVENMSNFYTSTVYEKGSEIIRMMAIMVGRENFRKAVKFYLDMYDGQAVTCEDFIDAIEQYSQMDLGQFRNWYSQNGTPKLHMTREFNSETSELTLKFKQIYNEKGENFKPFHIPFKMELINPKNGHFIETGLEKGILHIKDANSEFKFACPDADVMPLVSGLRDFSAPVVYTSDMSDDEVALLMQFDNSDVSNVESFSNFKNKEILAVINGEKDSFSPVISSFIDDQLTQMMLSDFDYAIVDNILAVPAVSYLTTQVQEIDLEKINESVDAFKLFVAESCSAKIRMSLEFLVSIKIEEKRLDEHYDFNYDIAKMRSIRYKLINLLSLVDADLAMAYLPEDLDSANFSDKMAALSSFCNYKLDTGKRSDLIDSLFEFSKDNFNAFTSFLITVCSGDELDFDEIIASYESMIDFTNPNMVRSFIGGLAMHKSFKNLDGKGYHYVKSKIIDLDKTNASLASRLISALDYSRHKEERMVILKECLMEIKSKVKSSELLEQVNKMLSV